MLSHGHYSYIGFVRYHIYDLELSQTGMNAEKGLINNFFKFASMYIIGFFGLRTP